MCVVVDIIGVCLGGSVRWVSVCISDIIRVCVGGQIRWVGRCMSTSAAAYAHVCPSADMGSGDLRRDSDGDFGSGVTVMQRAPSYMWRTAFVVALLPPPLSCITQRATNHGTPFKTS